MVITLGYEHPSNGVQRFLMVRPSLKTDEYEVLQWGSETSERTGRYDYSWPYADSETACEAALKTARFLRNTGWCAL